MWMFDSLEPFVLDFETQGSVRTKWRVSALVALSASNLWVSEGYVY